MHVLFRILVKELLQLRRDRKMIPAMIIGPLIQLLALGYAANRDVTNVPLLLVDRDRSSASRDLALRFTKSGSFTLAGTAETEAAIDPWLVRGEAQIALVIPEGYGREVAAGGAPRVQLVADGSDASSAVVGLSYARSILSGVVSPPSPAAAGGIDLRPRVFYNPDLRSRWFYVPAILAMVLMLVTMILPSMAVVREKEIGTLEQLIVTPIRPPQLILGKLLPFALIGLLDAVLVILLAVHLFRVPLRGSPLLLLALTLLFLMNTLGLGLLVSTLVRTQQQAMMTATFLLMVPMIYLSGLIFPIENMPRPIQAVTYGIPLRYYAIIVRGIFLKGSGLAALWPEALTLAGTGVLSLALASLRFRKSLD